MGRNCHQYLSLQLTGEDDLLINVDSQKLRTASRCRLNTRSKDFEPVHASRNERNKTNIKGKVCAQLHEYLSAPLLVYLFIHII